METPEHAAWRYALARCYCQGAGNYKYYGGRGITMCERWRNDFAAFLADMGPRPPRTTLDRIDSDGNYEPGNCRWADKRTQQNNCRSNRRVSWHGWTMTLAEWERLYGLNPSVLSTRLRLGWPIEKALTTKVRRCIHRSAKRRHA